MNWLKFNHKIFKDEQGKHMSSVNAFSPDRASGYAKKLFEMRVKGWGDAPRAVSDCARRSNMSPRSYERLMKGETKDPSMTIFGRVRKAYLDYCHEQIERLQHEIAIEMTRSGDESFEDLAAEAEALAAKIEAARKGR